MILTLVVIGGLLSLLDRVAVQEVDSSFHERDTYVYVYICIYICICVCVHICVYMYIYIYAY